MPATVTISETNGAPAGTPTDITKGHYGTTDTHDINNFDTEPIPPPTNSMNKWWRLHCTGGTFVSIASVRFWRSSGGLPANTEQKCSGRASPSNPSVIAYQQPSRTYNSGDLPYDMVSSDPGSANVGIGGSGSGTLTGPGFSDYFAHMIRVLGGATDGNPTGQITMSHTEIS